MTDQQGVQLNAHAKAARTATKQAGVSWPFPADRRLDQLVDIANEAGAGVRRNELAAALVAAAPTDPEALLELVLAWRRSEVRDVLIGLGETAQVVEIPRHPPGRRRA
ncbi:hypothetical protein [Mycobacterium sp. 236(2023)]|uniref:hypothetical protein n=1 Tax=Mycobacterium sp. 236(2023) TaxID=3038163 RepID=UPI00241529EE|nr:hypothetical protein [Mycobacterium sp. 236(2023)]MDG4667337.1 hypothetical protein [Mycobacterium sp. 236(2023)]